jgi:hypothetical protein
MPINDQFDDDHENIETAVRYHESFPDPDAQCSMVPVYFFGGRKVDQFSEVGRRWWIEVGGPLVPF